MSAVINERSHSGFTLVELLTVIVLIGILTVTVIPNFFGRSEFAEYALRDQLVSSFRYAQQRAMYDQSGDCYRLNIDANGFGPQRDDGTYIDPIGEVSLLGDYSGLTIAAATVLYFDGLGNTYTTDCGIDPIAAATPLVMTINPLGVQLEFYSTGFIRKL